ncbi:MAG: uracil-DNA glycosylase [Deltaproteobacteria bacterium]|nr:uracil-DNA glycosylase [Deltaproteobacteria bacterium]
MGGERDLKSLHHGIVQCVQCPLHESRLHAVPGEGDAHAALMLVGEAPGEQEDRQGRPFCGRSGRFLDRLLEKVGLRRPEVFITSTVKCRPPDNRNPRKIETDTCRDLWLVRQIALIDPAVVGIMGRVAAEAVLGEKGNLRDLHGRLIERDGRRYLITYHPAAAMRFPEAAGHIEADFRKLAAMAG